MSDDIVKSDSGHVDVNGPSSVDDVSQAEDLNSNEISKDTLELPHGEALEIRDTYAISASVPAKLIVIAGSVSSGKTTMLTSVYHLFQQGSFANYMFAGSKTLIGFEKRCYPARISSENIIAQTIRTRRSVSDSILHLRLRDNDCLEEIQDLLITDFSGEDYEAINANVPLAQSEFGTIIKRANLFILLVDGDKLSDNMCRHSTKQQSLMFLRTLRDSSLLDVNSNVDVLINKYDIVKKKCDGNPKISLYIDTFKSDVVSNFKSAFKNIRVFEIAARPTVDTDDIKLGYGLEKVIPYWAHLDLGQYMSDTPPDADKQKLSEFDLFLFRTLNNGGQI